MGNTFAGIMEKRKVASFPHTIEIQTENVISYE
jgi:hypothetical protein